MIAELARLGVEIGRKIEGDGDDAALQDAFADLTQSVQAHATAKPDAERAAIMLLSAGQVMYGDSDLFDDWDKAVDAAQKLLGIIPLTPAK